jgi:hypothetical protein
MVQGQSGQKVCKAPSQPIAERGGTNLSFQQWQEGGQQSRLDWAKDETLSQKKFIKVIGL